MICDFGGRTLKTMLFEANRHTRPVTVTVSEEEHASLTRNILEERNTIPKSLPESAQKKWTKPS